MSYLHGLYLDSFQTTKRHSYDGYSIYIAIFNSFHEAVYPVGVTTNQSCFTRIIGHNSRTIHWMYTKVDARIRLWTPFLCAKFQGNRSTHLRFIAIFASVRKHKEERRRKRRKKMKLWQLIPQKWLERFPSNFACRLPWLAGNSVANLVSIGSWITEIQKCENEVFFLQVNISTVLHAGFLGRTTHYRVS